MKGSTGNLRQLFLAGTASAALFMSTSASAIDVDAGDYQAAPPGTNLGLLYLQHASRDDLNTDIGILRLVHFTEIGGMVADPQVLIPFGRVDPRGRLAELDGSSGIGDVIFASTFWPQNDPDRGVWTGFTPYLYVPTGEYDRNKGTLNLGENRWKFNLQVAHVRRLSERFSIDLVGDVMIHGDNKDFGSDGVTRSQDPLYQVQSWLRYHTSPTSDLRFLVSHVWGGENTFDGVAAGDEARVTKVGIGGSFFVGPKTQIIAIAGRDVSVRDHPDLADGLKENGRVNIRILRIF